MNILIAGFPYVRKSYFDTFKFYPEKDRMFFLLPKIWKAKGGKVIFRPPVESNVFTTEAYFYHSNYPLVGGLLKGWMPFSPLALLRLRFGNQINLVFNCNEPVLLTSLYNSFWAKVFGLKNILFSWENVPHETKLKGFKWLVQKFILNLNLFLCDGVICGNKKGAEIFKKLTQKPVAIIPMSGLDEEFFRPSGGKIKKEFGGINLEGKIVFSFAGAIGFRKGIHLIIRALPKVLEQIPNSVLIIAGKGEYEEAIDKLTRDLNLEEFVIKIPWLDQNQLSHLLSISDVFLYPSLPYGGWEEQFGYSMAEASLMELPVISTHSGSIADIVLNKKTGILVPPGDILALANAMCLLGKNRAMRVAMGKAGREYIKANFSYEIVANQFYEFFRGIS